jgi:hypothetical protein
MHASTIDAEPSCYVVLAISTRRIPLIMEASSSVK